MKYLDLFSGIGGFAIPLEEQGHECVGFSEIDRYATQIYKKHFPNHPEIGDITKINASTLPDFDLLVGGFPCQAFSIAGKREGFSDTRGTLFFDISRILEAKKPRYFLLENVKGLLSHDGGSTFSTIIEILQEIGYIIDWEVHNSKNFGVPQNRERIFLSGNYIPKLCQDLKDGQTESYKQLKKIGESYLFQLLLNSLAEVKKLQEIKSKEWVLGYLILKEILKSDGLSQILKSSPKTLKSLYEKFASFSKREQQSLFCKKQENSEDEESRLKEIQNIMDTSRLEMTEGFMWQSIELFLKNIWEENYLKQSKFTILTAIKKITNWRTFSFAKTSLSTLVLIAHLRDSRKNSWKEILLNLIVIKEPTKYARLNNQTQKTVISESGVVYESELFTQNRERVFIFGVRGECPREILPIAKNGEGINEAAPKFSREVRTKNDIANCLTARYYKMAPTDTYIQQRHRGKNKGGNHKIAPTLSSSSWQDNNHLVAPVLTPDRPEKRQNGRRFKNPGEPAFTLTAQDRHGILIENKIRRLTPTECERLQSFPDYWTQKGINEKGEEVGISDSQRYKCCGNAVTVNVVRAITKSLFE